ncbi:hypothetical protein [Phaeocystidibacter marisrubri]|uniref:Uncharacterized protein n=1 Tax=Phaeocystidibacter marisrubri TaxID=1577780 RepID=A0A6L3ZIT8_9FLAO|nr:hypothetical protein [Phaeocystidibacter marisrubri]KAB2817385.1 hypothetical protein F8C82_03040 [Phaeocystidibacter marisrubri]
MLFKSLLSPLQSLILLIALTLVSCNDASPSAKNAPTSTDTATQNVVTYSDVTLEWNMQGKVYEVGRPHLMTDSCSLHLACDCCMAKIAFNSDGNFYDMSYCMSDQAMRSGVFNVQS